jgi:hypothetical protein
MKIKVHINQAEALRRGIDAKSPTKMITIKPSALPEAVRQLLADNFILGTTDIKDDVKVVAASLPELVNALVMLRGIASPLAAREITEWYQQARQAEGGLLSE